jgi:uncharacterized repeat protein (TIGR03837 family)
MRIGIICKVIDNYGDAGFSLRLAKALAKLSHEIILLHNAPMIMQALYPSNDFSNLQLIDAREWSPEYKTNNSLDLILEPFGTSSEQTNHRFDLILKQSFPKTPWLLIEYLSSEQWIEDFHLNHSIDTKTEHLTTFFYPGFTSKTGGIIHSDLPAHLTHPPISQLSNTLKLFVFAYPNAPIIELLRLCEKEDSILHLGLAGKWPDLTASDHITFLPFYPQEQFDDLLAQYNILFVRGEDSFVRAQLAGKPFIWQIYPTDDGIHAIKLSSFFDRYSAGLTSACASAVWQCWASWNCLDHCLNFSISWNEFIKHLPELNQHALAWRNDLLNGPELVDEILKWRLAQKPDLME